MQARQNQNDFEEAITDYGKVLSIEPENKAAMTQIIVCKRKLASEHEKQKKMFGKIFQKLAESNELEDAKSDSASKDAAKQEAATKSETEPCANAVKEEEATGGEMSTPDIQMAEATKET
ncbi:unnamed protein product [Soboliphyme baturini]|uniref:TPR_REGION domain-containing protein n=1 Tax=Soboliphyme baturini TaxID=241478 RepID=A0A183J602_9BILA|nr:unnamed protein product [Soboliphyme baturini]